MKTVTQTTKLTDHPINSLFSVKYNNGKQIALQLHSCQLNTKLCEGTNDIISRINLQWISSRNFRTKCTIRLQMGSRSDLPCQLIN